MGENDCNVHHPDMCTVTVLTQVVETVDDVHWKPTHSKQTHNDGQRFGSVHLLLQGRTRWGRRRGNFSRSRRVSNFEPHQSELAPSGHEDIGIDDQHDQQGNQHTAEKIEIDHVVQMNHFFKQALRQAFRADWVSDCGGAVPSCGTQLWAIHCQTSMYFHGKNDVLW